MAEKLDVFVKKFNALDLKSVISNAVAADKAKPSSKGQKLLKACHEAYVSTLKNANAHDQAIDGRYEECLALLKAPSAENLDKAQVKINDMRKELTTAAKEFTVVEKLVADLKKEYKL